MPDDSFASRRLFSLLPTNARYAVRGVPNANKASERIKEPPPDLVMVDGLSLAQQSVSVVRSHLDRRTAPATMRP